MPAATPLQARGNYDQYHAYLDRLDQERKASVEQFRDPYAGDNIQQHYTLFSTDTLVVLHIVCMFSLDHVVVPIQELYII